MLNIMPIVYYVKYYLGRLCSQHTALTTRDKQDSGEARLFAVVYFAYSEERASVVSHLVPNPAMEED